MRITEFQEQVKKKKVTLRYCNKRYRTFKFEINSHHIPCATYELAWNQFDLCSYIEVADEILTQYPDIDGIFSVNLVIIAMLRQALKRCIRVPQALR